MLEDRAVRPALVIPSSSAPHRSRPAILALLWALLVATPARAAEVPQATLTPTQAVDVRPHQAPDEVAYALGAAYGTLGSVAVIGGGLLLQDRTDAEWIGPTALVLGIGVNLGLTAIPILRRSDAARGWTWLGAGLGLAASVPAAAILGGLGYLAVGNGGVAFGALPLVLLPAAGAMVAAGIDVSQHDHATLGLAPSVRRRSTGALAVGADLVFTW